MDFSIFADLMADICHFRTGFCEQRLRKRKAVERKRTHLVLIAGEEHCAIANPQGALLLLTLGVHLRDGPCLNGVGLRLVGCGRDSFRGVDVGANWSGWLRRLDKWLVRTALRNWGLLRKGHGDMSKDKTSALRKE